MTQSLFMSRSVCPFLLHVNPMIPLAAVALKSLSGGEPHGSGDTQLRATREPVT